MNIDLNKTISFTFSTIAIILSILSIIITRKNVKKQLRLNKLEEILEILYFIKGYYSTLFILFIDTESYAQSKLNNTKLPDYPKDLSERKERFIENVSRETIINKISRLNILSNTYLPNKKNLKLRIHSISNTYYYMCLYIFTNGETPINEEYSLIPKRGQIEKFLNKIESDILIEMNLGYRSIDKREQKEYLKTKFLKDLENE